MMDLESIRELFWHSDPLKVDDSYHRKKKETLLLASRSSFVCKLLFSSYSIHNACSQQ